RNAPFATCIFSRLIFSSTRPMIGGMQATPAGPAVQRQFVNFAFFKLDPAFRRIPDDDKWQARSEFLKLFQSPWENMMCLTYSTTGLKADCDFLLWRISASPDSFQA